MEKQECVVLTRDLGLNPISSIKTIKFVQWFICISCATLDPSKKDSIVIQNWHMQLYQVSNLKKTTITYSHKSFLFIMTCFPWDTIYFNSRFMYIQLYRIRTIKLIKTSSKNMEMYTWSKIRKVFQPYSTKIVLKRVYLTTRKHSTKNDRLT